MANRGSIQDFSPTTDSMKNYLNHYFKANKVETDLQVSTLMASIGAFNYEHLCDIKPAPDESGSKTLDEVSAVVLKHFKSRRVQ